ncbi:MAG: hypothetical protein JF570_04765, partial [Caulobacter sp.]|nr:hypothetical protein [Caulobacter sp.]
GNDFLHVDGGGDDIAYGGAGDDTIWASSATDAALVTIYGGDGGDDVVLFGNVGATNFLVDLGAGSDQVTVWDAAGQATIDAGAGDDVVRVNRTTLQVTLGAGHDFVGLDQVQATNVVTITDFQVSGASSDRLNIFDPLHGLGWNGATNPFTADLIRLVQDGADTLVQMKLTQALPGQDGFHAVARLIGVQANTLTAESFNGFDPLGGANAPEVTLVGGIDADHLVGTVGGDLLQGGDGADVLDGGAGDDTLQGGAGDDIMQPTGGGNDSLNGGDGKDTLRIIWTANHGDHDTLNGDAGDDFLEFNSTYADAAAMLNGGEGADQIRITGVGEAQVHGDGGGGDDVIFAGAGNDVLDGGTTGETTVSTQTWQGPGDTLSYMLLYMGVGVTVSLADTFAQNTGGGGVDTISNFENLNGSLYDDQLSGDDRTNLILGGTGADVIFGNGGADRLVGGDGDDELDGGAGVDHLEGGMGNDTYVVGAGDILLEQGGEGVDTVKANFNYTLGSEIENLILLSGALTGTGNAQGNVITGNAANNTIDGGGGDDILAGGLGGDVLDGGAGADYASYAGAAGGVTVFLGGAYLNAGEAAGDSYAAIEGVIGSAYADLVGGTNAGDALQGYDGNDWLLGIGGDDWLVGGTGNDLLEGGVGHDVMDGGSGDDVASYRQAAAGVTAYMDNYLANAGEAFGDQYAAIENLWGSDFADTLGGTEAAGQVYGFG